MIVSLRTAVLAPLLCLVLVLVASPVAPALAEVDLFEPGEECVIVGKNVHVRAEGSTDAKSIARLSAPQVVEVKAVGGAQRIGKWGVHSWYLITWTTKRGTFTGWIFGAFLSTTRGC